MYSDDRDARKQRAQYVHAAVDGRNVKSGEETTIPISRRDDDVRELLDRLYTDRQAVAETDIAALEAEIDEAVYDYSTFMKRNERSLRRISTCSEVELVRLPDAVVTCEVRMNQ